MGISYSKSFVIDLFKKMAVGAGLGATADAAVELFQVPVLNDSGTFGNANMSNFEVAGYALGIAGTTAGIADIAVSKGVISFTSDTFPIFLGWVLGIYFYEHTFADLTGIRKFDPYETIGGYIPPVLPSDTELPFLDMPSEPMPA